VFTHDLSLHLCAEAFLVEWCKDRWHSAWRSGLHPGSTESMIFAVICVAAATGIRAAFGEFGPESSAFAPYYCATLITALVGGVPAASVAAALGGIVGYLLFLPAEWKNDHLFTRQLISVVQYSIFSFFIIWAAQSHRRLVQRLRAEETTRQLLNRELVHRINNVLTSVQAIVSQSLKGQDQGVLGVVNARIAALGATHDLLLKSDWQSASMREIATQELSPFGLLKCELEGENVQCPAEAAIVLALIFHELTTNAVKYGALSRPEGRVSVSWQKVKDRLNVKWSERGGPSPVLQIGKGFGMRLLQSGLKPFRGRADVRLEPTGLVCDLYLELPDGERQDHKSATHAGGESGNLASRIL
jgi:two-component sensor histidine kinase